MGKARKTDRVTSTTCDAEHFLPYWFYPDFCSTAASQFCEDHFLPPWMYEDFCAHLDFLPVPPSGPVVLPKGRTTRAPKPKPPPVVVVPVVVPVPVLAAAPAPAYFWGWYFGHSEFTRGVPLGAPTGQEFSPSDFMRSQYPAGSRFFENIRAAGF